RHPHGRRRQVHQATAAARVSARAHPQRRERRDPPRRGAGSRRPRAGGAAPPLEPRDGHREDPPDPPRPPPPAPADTPPAHAPPPPAHPSPPPARRPARPPAEVSAYIRSRLERAGAQDGSLFTPDALGRIAEVTEGIPRLVNVLCDSCLVAGFAGG